jgi:hypothetical protein
VRRDCVFATPPNGPRLSQTVRRSDDKRFSNGITEYRYLSFPRSGADSGLLGYISRARNLWRFVVDTTRRVCMRALNTTASTFPDALRSQKKEKMNLEMHALRPSSATGYTTPTHRVGIHQSIPWRRAWIAPVFTPFGPASAELFALQRGTIGTHSVVKIFAHGDMRGPLL